MLDNAINDGIKRQATSLAELASMEVEHSVVGYAKLLCELVSDISGGHEERTEFQNVCRFVCVGSYHLSDKAVQKRVAENALATIHALGRMVGDVEDMADMPNGRLARVKGGVAYDISPVQVVYLANELAVPVGHFFERFEDRPELLRQALLKYGVLATAEAAADDGADAPISPAPTKKTAGEKTAVEGVVREASRSGDPSLATTKTAEKAPGSTSVLGEPLKIKISKVHPDPRNPRKHFNRTSLEELADSIEKKGQETPANVSKDPTIPGHFQLTSGERRLRALNIIWDRRGRTPENEPTIECFIRVIEGGSHERLIHAFMENEHREEMCPVDKAAGLAELHRGGESISSLAKLMGYSDQMVRNYIAVDGLPEEVKALMDPNLPDTEQLKITIAIDLTHVSSPELQLELAKEAVERELGIFEARNLFAVRGGVGAKGLIRAGHERAPGKRYQMMTRFVGRTKSWITDFLHHGRDPIDDAFFHRDNEDEEREKLARKLRATITKLQELLDYVENKPTKGE